MLKNTTEMINNFEKALNCAKDTPTDEEKNIVYNYKIGLAKALIKDLGNDAVVIADIIKAAVPKEDTYSKCYMCQAYMNR